MDRLLKHMQRVRPAAFCSRDFFLLHDNAPTKLQVFASFWPQKISNPLSFPPRYYPDLFLSDYFLLSKLKMKLKDPLCGCCWDPRSCNLWIKEGPNRGIFEGVLCLRFLKKIISITFGLHCVYLTNHSAMCLAGVEVCLKHKLVQVDGGVSMCYNVVIITTIMWLSWDWATCWSVSVLHIQNSL